MGRKNRIIMIEKTLNKIALTSELETQKIRVKLVSQLEQLFNYAVEMTQVAENREEWMKVAGYIAQVIKSIIDSYDEVKWNEDLQKLRDLIEQAKKRAGAIGAGAGGP